MRRSESKDQASGNTQSSVIGRLGMLRIGPSSTPTRTFDHSMFGVRSLTSATLALTLSNVISGGMPYFDKWQLSLLASEGQAEMRWVPSTRITDARDSRHAG